MPATRVSKKKKQTSRARRVVSRPIAAIATFPEETELHRETPTEAGADGLFTFSNFMWRQRVVPAILLVLITFALFIQVAHHPFTNYDDGEYVQQNTQIQHGITLSMLHWAFTSVDHANWHPITWISHAVDWQLFGPSPGGHHVMSLLLHIATVVLLFLFLTEMTGSTIRSLAVALLFAIHPVSVESVAWIAERKNVLCALFFMAALLAYNRYARRPHPWSYLVVGVLFGLSLASKAMAVTFPFVLLLLDFWPLQRIKSWTNPSRDSDIPQFEFSRLILEKLPFLALSVADSVITMMAQRAPLHDAAKFGILLRFENAIVSYAGYLWNILWPTHLSVLYPFPPSGFPTWKIIVSGIVLVAGSVIAWRKRTRGYLLTGWCWFLGTLLPVIGLLQVGEQAMADRYAYLPLVGIYIIAVWGTFDLTERANRNWHPVMVAGAAMVFVALSVAAWEQMRVWRSNIDLWKHAVSVTTNNRGAEDALGDTLLEGALSRGIHYSDEAVVHIQNALRIDPHDSRALLSMGMDLRGRGRSSEALGEYKLALEYAGQGNSPEDRAMRSEILSGMASCYETLGDFMTARQYYQEAMQLSPANDPDLFASFARTFTDEETAKLAATLVHSPTAQGYWQLGQLQESTSRTEEAKKSYRQALEIDPHFVPAQTALAGNESQPQ